MDVQILNGMCERIYDYYLSSQHQDRLQCSLWLPQIKLQQGIITNIYLANYELLQTQQDYNTSENTKRMQFTSIKRLHKESVEGRRGPSPEGILQPEMPPSNHLALFYMHREAQ